MIDANLDKQHERDHKTVKRLKKLIESCKEGDYVSLTEIQKILD